MGTTGGKVDWMTFRDGLAEFGGEGRNIRRGMLRNGVDELGRRMVLTRWCFAKLSG